MEGIRTKEVRARKNLETRPQEHVVSPEPPTVSWGGPQRSSIHPLQGTGETEAGWDVSSVIQGVVQGPATVSPPMMPLAQQASLKEQAAWALPGSTCTSLTWLLGVRTLWLWLWVHMRPGSGPGVWLVLYVRNQGLVCGWGSRPKRNKKINGLETIKWAGNPKDRSAKAVEGCTEVRSWGSEVSGGRKWGLSPPHPPLPDSRCVRLATP